MERRFVLGSRVAFVAGALALVACGGGADDLGPPIVVTTPEGGCNDLTRTIARWQTQETTACSPLLLFRSIIPLGPDLFVAWSPPGRDLWRLGPNIDVQAGPVAAVTPGGPAYNRIRIALGGDRVFEYNQQTGETKIFAVDATANGYQDPLPRSIVERKWFQPPGGRDLVALDDSHLLDWRPGTGEYAVVRFRRDQELTEPYDRFEAVGRREDAFRRGHRLVMLGRGRLLEWVPLTRAYRVWRYDLGRLPGDIFDPEPVPGASGQWPELERKHELVVLPPDRLMIWDREAGTVEIREFEPEAPDPLSGRRLGVTGHDRLRSRLPAWEKPTTSAIRRVVIVFQEGRSFDAYFGRYCQALPGSEPTCTAGPACCEAMPDAIPGAGMCRVLDPADDAYIPNGTPTCLVAKMNVPHMDRFAVPTLPGCGDPRDFACAATGDAAGPIGVYHALAAQGVLADRYFASIADDAEKNLGYFGIAGYVPMLANANGITIGALLALADVPWAMYFGDPADARKDPGPKFPDGRWIFMRELHELFDDVAMEELAPVSVVIAGAAANEAPGHPRSLIDGAALVERIARTIAGSSRYAGETLTVLVHATSGGFYDHVPPPPTPAANFDPALVPYGPRVPFVALGPFVRRGQVSHTRLEHSSLTVFIEWNWLDGQTGHLGARDRFVSNIGSLLDHAATGVPVPE